MYNSPYRSFDLRYAYWNWLSLSYTHSFSRTFSATGTVNYQSLNRHRWMRRWCRNFTARRPMEFKLKLLKTFGKLAPKPASAPTLPTGRCG